MKLTANKVLRYFKAIKLHFNSETYDCFKYKFQIRGKHDASTHSNRFQLEKIAKHPDPFGLILANISKNPQIFISDLVTKEAEKIYSEWRKRYDALGYYFCEEIRPLCGIRGVWNLSYWVPVPHSGYSEYPLVFKEYLASRISLEVFAIFTLIAYSDDENRLIADYDQAFKDDIVWKQTKFKIQKYIPFLPKFDKKKFIKMWNTQFQN